MAKLKDKYLLLMFMPLVWALQTNGYGRFCKG